MTEEIIEAIKLVPKKEWQRFFESLRQELYTTIRTDPHNLTTFPAMISLLDQLESKFVNPS